MLPFPFLVSASNWLSLCKVTHSNFGPFCFFHFIHHNYLSYLFSDFCLSPTVCIFHRDNITPKGKIWFFEGQKNLNLSMFKAQIYTIRKQLYNISIVLNTIHKQIYSIPVVLKFHSGASQKTTFLINFLW